MRSHRCLPADASRRDEDSDPGPTEPRDVKRWLPAPCRRHRRAFTLVEMLLATALCAVLLGALWMLMSTYGELFDKGQQQVERVQLCRALLEQLADDLRSAIQDPLPGTADEAAGAAQRRRFGLFGSSRELRLDMLQLTPHQGNPIPVGRTGGGSEETKTARVPELRTVHYSFLVPGAGDETAESRNSGLVRRELDFETPLQQAAHLDAADESHAADDPDTGDDTRLWVPEVASLQFRYFDGRGWSDAWNSLERKSLPAAVEIQLQLADLPPRIRGRAEIGKSGTDAPTETAGGEQDEPGAEPAAGRSGTIYRLVVDLPSSSNYRPPSTGPQKLVRSSVRRPVQRIAPPRWTPPAAPAPLPEDWIRTGTR